MADFSKIDLGKMLESIADKSESQVAQVIEGNQAIMILIVKDKPPAIFQEGLMVGFSEIEQDGEKKNMLMAFTNCSTAQLQRAIDHLMAVFIGMKEGGL